jgi:hypothetical protein
MNITNKNLEINNQQFELEENSNEILKKLTNYIPNLLNHLWEKPELVAFLLSNSNIKDIKEHLASFIVNNFYENILLSNSVENNLMYVFTLMLKEEINSLDQVNEPEIFLNINSPCSYLLNELTKKDNIRQYFKKVLLDVIENIESYSSDKTLNLNIKSYQNIVEKNKSKFRISFTTKKVKKPINDSQESIEREKGVRLHNSIKNVNRNTVDSLSVSKNYLLNDKRDIVSFTQKYVSKLTIDDLKKLIVEKYEDDENMASYCTNQIINCGQNIINRDYYANKDFMEIVYCTRSSSDDVLNLYQNDFYKIIKIIDQILLNIKNNMYFLPYSLKCLCKIISKLITKKFPDINLPQNIAFISQFFINILLKSIMNNPGFNLLIDDFIISKNTLKNIKLVIEIISQMTSGKLYINSEKNNGFTPFNWYFLDKMPIIFDIFEELTKVSLPSFIEKLLDDKIGEKYRYNFFKENADDDIFYRTICFNLYDIDSILNNINKIKEQFFNRCDNSLIKKTFEKLYTENNKKLLKELIKNCDCEVSEKQKNIKESEHKEKQKLTYFLISSLLTNDKCKDVVNVKFKSFKRYTTIELKAMNQPDNTDYEKNIIKVKKFMKCLLYNYRNFSITDFDTENRIKTKYILYSLKEYNKDSNFIIEDSIPIEWYVNSLLDYLDKIPKNYIENDYQKLYDEIESDLNEAIKKIDIEIISSCFEKVKLAQKENNYYDEKIRLTNNLFLNEKAQKIVEEEYIPVKIFFTYNDNKKEFYFSKSKTKEKDYIKKKTESKIKQNFCKSIKSFTKKFPNLNIDTKGCDIFKIQTKLNMPEKILEYIEFIKDHLVTNKKIINSQDMDLILERIYDYIMTKIYKKIFPIDENEKDIKIYKKCLSLSWTEPKHFIQKKENYIYDCFLKDAKYYFEKIGTEKSPKNKILNIKELFNSINKLIAFNGDDNNNVGVDDLMPILNYAFVKVNPEMIYSSLKFIELYIGNLRSKEEGSQLTQLIALCDYICNIEYNNIFEISKEEYILNCGNQILNLENYKDNI